MKPDASDLSIDREYTAWEFRNKQFRERDTFNNLIADEA